MNERYTVRMYCKIIGYVMLLSEVTHPATTTDFYL